MRVLILDRDGVINFDSPDYIKSLSEWRPIPGSLEAMSLAAQQGFKIFIASNQSGLARGLFNQATLDDIHEALIEKIAQLGGHIDGIVYCPHGPDDACDCRKPKPGLLYQIRDRFGVNLSDALVIGDSYRDLEAAFAANVQATLVRTGNGEKTLAKYPQLIHQIPVFSDLQQAILHWISHEKNT